MAKLKILMVNASDINYGAARAAYRLHKGLSEAAIDSRLLVQQKHSDDYTVIGPGSRTQKAFSMARVMLDPLPVQLRREKPLGGFSPSWVPFSLIHRKIRELNPDIIHLHWICEGMMRIEDLALIKKPIVWSMHDMWSFTGGCHVSGDCDNYTRQCGECPVLCSNTSNDLSRRIFNRKKQSYRKIDNLTFVGPSSWIIDCAKKSALLKNHKIEKIPNPIDTRVFNPVNKSAARKIAGFPENKKIVLFGAINPAGDLNKGFKQLIEALDKVPRKDIQLVVFGAGFPENPPPLKFDAVYTGILRDDIALKIIYSAADLTVIPSKQESFGQTATESMACGTPVACFDSTGLKDIVDHKINGYRAAAFDAQDLARGISWILEHSSCAALSENSVMKIKSFFETEKVAGQFSELYSRIISQR